MASFRQVAKRLVLGPPVRSDRMGETLLPKRLALPVFASDPLSSVTYATQEILLILSLVGSRRSTNRRCGRWRSPAPPGRTRSPR